MQFKSLCIQHRHIHPILKVEITKDGHILIIQPYREKGSLRDTLNKVAKSFQAYS